MPCEVQFARFSSFFCCLLPCTNCVCVGGEKFKNKIKLKKKRLCNAHPLSWTACGLLPFVPPLHSSALQLSGPWSFALASLSAHSLLGVGKLEAWQRESPKLPGVQPRGQPRQLCAGMLHLEERLGDRSAAPAQGYLPGKASGNSGRGSRAIQVTPPLLSFHTCTHSSRASYSPGFFLDQAAMRLHCMDFATRMHPYLW